MFVVAAYLQAQPLPEPETAPLVKRDDEPEIVCTLAPITGARAKEQKLCRTPRYEKGGEAWRNSIRAIQRGEGNAQPQPGG